MKKTYFVERYENNVKTDRYLNLTEEEAKTWLSLNGRFVVITFKAFDYDTFEEVTF